MDKFPLFLDGKSAGELTEEKEALYTWFEARCRLPEEGLWCAWAVGAAGELRLGVLEPTGERAVIRRRFSRRMTEPLGPLLRGEARPLSAGAADWKAVAHPEELFRTPFLRQQLRGAAGALVRETAEGRFLALPWDPRRPFFLTGLFCFTRVQRIGGREYGVFAFDRGERPLFP
ncbi:MAG: hypothetical protein RR350_00715 [Oscillibacter sp.]